MTRINCVPVEELTDKHLVAEYRELPRIFKLARVLHDYEKVPEYRLGTGHVKFFYDKLGYCLDRQTQLYEEMLDRGFHPNYDPTDLFDEWYGKKCDLWGEWVPTKKAMEINRERIKERLNASGNNER